MPEGQKLNPMLRGSEVDQLAQKAVAWWTKRKVDDKNDDTLYDLFEFVLQQLGYDKEMIQNDKLLPTLMREALMIWMARNSEDYSLLKLVLYFFVQLNKQKYLTIK